MMKRALVGSVLGVLGLAVVTLYAYLFWTNNRELAAVDIERVQDSYERTVSWMLHNADKVLDQQNAMLWSMVQRSANLAGDSRLLKLFEEYERRHVSRNNVWRGLFVRDSWLPMKFEDLSHFPEYNKYFIYAMYCEEEFSIEPEIAMQNEAEYCGYFHLLRPACVTHQLMGMRIRTASGCGARSWLKSMNESLLATIETQLVWDFRVVDVYLQRVMMLLESGSMERVRPRWVHSVLDAQLMDGGWGNTYPLLKFGSRTIAIKGFGLYWGKAKSDFHATAQGLFIMTLLLHQHAYDAERGWVS